MCGLAGISPYPYMSMWVCKYVCMSICARVYAFMCNVYIYSYTCFRSIYCLTVRTNPVSSSSLNCGMLLRLWRLMQRWRCILKYPFQFYHFFLHIANVQSMYMFWNTQIHMYSYIHINVVLWELRSHSHAHIHSAKMYWWLSGEFIWNKLFFVLN